ncbi:hypothetical protein BGZ65_011128 [Modicella reniformis]|uniref:Ubiquitin-like domain-containing protein n=1 Tax=Modicella reniformis TaxID=1440133 RepID=A0A9P6SUV5_9FUNG|nr:hypothetical protein BGZ65_011128 [Modicella reniformis]
MISNSSAATDSALVPETAVKGDQVDKSIGTLLPSEATLDRTDPAGEHEEQNLHPQQSEPLVLISSISSTVVEQRTCFMNGKKLPFEVDLNDTIGQLKYKLMALTNVEPKRQKLMLGRGKLPEDHVVLSSLSLKHNQTFLMMGTPEAKVIKTPEVLPDVLNDLEEDYTPDDEAFASMAQNQKSLRKTIASCTINIMNPLRPALNNALVDVMRPGLHDFLAVCYEHYDIVIWSQTSWKALEAKVTTIGLLTHSDYKISFVMDISTMFFVMSQRDGKPFKHQVKALDIIWAKFPQFSARNTIHVDDL